MTEGEALFASILENPEDDAPRLIYSDWLEENGNPERAAFIRVQCQLARTELFSPLFRKLAAKARRLYQPEWLHTLRGKVISAEMRRGFIHQVTMYSKRFVLEGQSLFDTEPIREIKFADFSAVRGNVPVSTLAVNPHLRRLTGLSITGHSVTGRMFDELLDGGNLRGLKKLSLERTDIEPAIYAHLLNPTRLPDLAELKIAEPTRHHETWLNWFSTCNVLPKIKSLSLSHDRSSRESLIEFLRHPALQSLEKLVYLVDYGSASIPIQECTHLKYLRDLDLPMNQISDQAFREFVENAQHANLKRLNLPWNRLTGVGIQAILNTEHLRGLYYLNLDGNHITGRSRWKALLREWCPEAIIRLN